VTPGSSRRLGGLALAATLFVAACSSGSSGTATPPASAAPASQAPASDAASPSAAPSAAMNAPQPGTASVTLQGAGATFPAPLYQVWFEKYNAAYPSVQVDYQAIGSGGGIKGITEQTVDFGASDAAMKDSEIAALPAGVTILHVPTALGAVVIIYNVPGVTTLNLDGDTVAGLFLGTITKWNDPKIAALNSGATLPDTAVTVEHRSDGSGTTNAFTTYLDTVSPEWHTKVGAGKEVNWPVGVGAQGNDGVAGGVKQTEGAVGYVELNYATQANLGAHQERRRQVRPWEHGRRHSRRRGCRRRLPGRLPPGADHQRRWWFDLPDCLVHLPADPGRVEGRRQGEGHGGVHLLGPQRRPVRGERARVCAAPRRDPGQGGCGAPHGHHRGDGRLAVVKGSSSRTDRPRSSARGRSVPFEAHTIEAHP
jgi:ABC-type phosphate transport system substrate-binding protein